MTSSTARETAVRELIYVGDPMCSWCWGIAPELEKLTAAHPELPLRIVVGGLRPGPAAQTVNAGTAEFLAEHWRHVGEASGQPFEFATLDRRDWVYDTEPPCRAIVTMRFLDPEAEFAFFARIQRAFYADGVIVSDEDVYPDLLEDFDLDVDTFMAQFRSAEMRRLTLDDFGLAQKWGITGFPTVLARDGDRAFALTHGWAPFETIETALLGVFEPDADGLLCRPGDDC